MSQKLTKKELRKKFTKQQRMDFHLARTAKAAGKGSQSKLSPKSKPFVPLKPARQPDKLLQKTGGAGTDTRSLKNQEKSEGTLVKVVTQDPTMDVGINLIDRCIQYFSMGVCLRAFKRGWNANNTDVVDYSYYAFVYLIRALRSAAQGTIPQLQQAPRYIWEMMYAIKPKVEGFKTGKIAYTNFVINTLSVEPQAIYPLGTGPEEFYLCWGRNTGNEVANGFCEVVPAANPYTDALGSLAVNTIWKMFPNDGLNEMIADPGEEAYMLHDTSLFAAAYAEYGSSYECPTGCVSTLYNERVIQCPIYSKFCYYQFGENEWRGNIELRRSGGSPCYIGPRCCELSTLSSLRNKVPPLFFFYNFDEFFETAALWLAGILESHIDAGLSTPTSYPLSSQQFQILLRQTILPYFDNDMAQDLRMSATETLGAALDMFPFSCGANGVSLTAASVSMKLPRVFIENLRCCRRVTAHLKGRSGAGDRNVLDYVPVLTRPATIPQMSQFLWGGANPLFTVVPGEVPIRLIDASYMDGNTRRFLDLNGTQIAAYAVLHNEFVAKLASSSTALLDAAAIEAGIPALNCNMLTTHVQMLVEIDNVTPQIDPGFIDVGGVKVPVGAVPPAAIVAPGVRKPKQGFVAPSKDVAISSPAVIKKQMSKKNLGYKLDLKTKVGAAPIGTSTYLRDTTSVISYTGTFPFLGALWKYQQNFIKPVRMYYAPVLTMSTQLYKTNYFQEFTVQAASVNLQFSQLQGNDNGPSLYDTHATLANMDVKTAVGTSLSEAEKDFADFQQEGKGGFFQQLGSLIGGWFDGV